MSNRSRHHQPATATEPSSGDRPVGVPWPGCGFGTAVKRYFKGYVRFKGRASRAEYWWTVLFHGLVSLLPLMPLVCLLPSIAVSVRRLHDTGRSGWKWVGITVGQVVCGLVFLGIRALVMDGSDVVYSDTTGLMMVVLLIASILVFVGLQIMLLVWLALPSNAKGDRWNLTDGTARRTR